LPLPDMVFYEMTLYGKPKHAALVVEKDIYDKETFIKEAREQYGDYSFGNKLTLDNIEEGYCRYDGINEYYRLTVKVGQGSFPVYYIEL